MTVPLKHATIHSSEGEGNSHFAKRRFWGLYSMNNDEVENQMNPERLK